MRRILAGQAQPVPDGALSPVVPLAWKTGTSYGYRDARAIDINARYLMGIWVGRLDSTPVAGQAGFTSAVPLLTQVNTLLASGTAGINVPADLRPVSVSKGTVCWPGGQALPAGDANCRRLITWLLDSGQPPTLLAGGQEGIGGTRLMIWRNAQSERVAADCPDARANQLLLWPLPVEPWLPPAERRSARLPSASISCPPQLNNDVTPLLLTSVIQGAVLRRPPATHALSSQGGQGERWGFLNGVPVSVDKRLPGLLFEKAGDYQLLVMDEAGQITTARFPIE